MSIEKLKKLSICDVKVIRRSDRSYGKGRLNNVKIYIVPYGDEFIYGTLDELIEQVYDEDSKMCSILKVSEEAVHNLIELFYDKHKFIEGDRVFFRYDPAGVKALAERISFKGNDYRKMINLFW